MTAVGGTNLTRSSTSRGWTEKAWSGAGSGCSAYVAKPVWQVDTGCARRTVADVAAVADPSTGVAVYDSFGSSGGANWYVFGGTSVAAPIIAAVYALAGKLQMAGIEAAQRDARGVEFQGDPAGERDAGEVRLDVATQRARHRRPLKRSTMRLPQP